MGKFYKRPKRQCPEVNLHPISIKCLREGHPWITQDKFSDKFPKEPLFLTALDANQKPLGQLLNDPDHSKIKARIWNKEGAQSLNLSIFTRQLRERLATALRARTKLASSGERQNFYLVFGEADQLPGLFILKLKDHLVVQYYSKVWDRLEEVLKSELGKALLENFPEWKALDIWRHDRVSSTDHELKRLNLPGIENQKNLTSFELSEFGINYRIHLGKYYDYGIYTDMAAIRKKLMPLFKTSKSLLNLYSYTGAFSLLGLKSGHHNVTSIDLSPPYMQWLEENIKLNPELNSEHHHSMVMPVHQGLEQLVSKGIKFDLIVSDPPSASCDKKKISSAYDNYKKDLPLLLKLLNPGGTLVAFLNTQGISWKKYAQGMDEVLKLNKNLVQAPKVTRLNLDEDCTRLGTFPEGDYLKGLVIKI